VKKQQHYYGPYVLTAKIYISVTQQAAVQAH